MSSSTPEQLESYLGGRWSRGDGVETELTDPLNGSVLATVSARGLDLEAALAFARQHGGPHLRSLSFAERAKLLGAVADVLALAKPASATALLSHAMVRDVAAANVLPAGALSLLCGAAGDLLDHVTAADVIAFTGSSDTGNRIRSHPNVLARGVLVNVEA